MIKHKYHEPLGFFWSPPGGGMDYGASAVDNLKREFKEETGLTVKVGKFLFVHEFLNVPLHAIELFFLIDQFKGTISKGYDPEIPHDRQIIQDIKFMEFDVIKKIDKKNRHQVFELCNNLDDLLNLGGYFRLS